MSGIQAFLGGILDYAGLFPPAQLPLEEAVRNYLGYLAHKHAWLLGRFVCPAPRLDEVVPLLANWQGATPIAFSVLGRGGNDTRELIANVKRDLADTTRFHEALGDKARVETFEIRLPASAFNPVSLDEMKRAVATTTALIEADSPAPLRPFFEPPAMDDAALVTLFQVLDDDDFSHLRTRCRPPGFKLRTGGLGPGTLPSIEQVAKVLKACATGVLFKATAGLHHAVRHFNPDANLTMHGFVNVFAAGCLAATQGLDEAVVRAILEDENPANFQISEQGLCWQKLTASPKQLALGRTTFTSFGSCSFEEPLVDLRKLGWIDDG